MAEVLLGEYEVERVLGAGGMGHVVLVRSRSTGQRFAVKRALPQNAPARALLLRELQTWIDLPPFPHFVTCHFFRTLGDEIAIFAEYVEGGSLADALRSGTLIALPDLLDAAIQLAWGLHAAHRLNVVHQDVKPSNALRTGTGLVKVADFGLAQAADARGARFGGALTRGYCSPEQAELLARGPEDGGRLTPATDQWSWGVTVLELFTGEPPCRHGGQVADSVLESFLAQGGKETGRPALPPLLAEVLRKCFARMPGDRWPSLEAAADVLCVAYTQATGLPYPRAKPEWPLRTSEAERSRSAHSPDEWEDPRDWLRRILRLTNESEISPPPPATGTSRRARAVADLALYSEAQNRLTALCQAGRTDLEPLLAELCLARAQTHWAADDVPGTLRLVEQAVNLLTPRIEAGQFEHAERLLAAYLRAAACHRLLGQLPAAIERTGQAIRLGESASIDSSEHLLQAYLSRARTYFLQEDYPSALADLERAREQTGNRIAQGRTDLEADLAEMELLTARVLRASGEVQASTAWLDHVVPRLERLNRTDPSSTPPHQLATALLTRARLLAAQENAEAAQRDAEQAWALWNGPDSHPDRPEVQGHLADVLAFQGGLCLQRDLPGESLRYFAPARTILERLVGPLGQTEYLPQLAQVCLQWAWALLFLDQPGEALPNSERGVNLLESLVAAGREDLSGDLARALTTHGRITQRLNLDPRPFLRTAVLLYEELVQTRGRWDLLPSLLRAQRQEARALIDADEPGTARERLGQARRLGEGIADARETPELLEALAEIHLELASLAIAQGHTPEAQRALCELLIRLERHPEAEPLRQRAIRMLSALW